MTFCKPFSCINLKICAMRRRRGGGIPVRRSLHQPRSVLAVDTSEEAFWRIFTTFAVIGSHHTMPNSCIIHCLLSVNALQPQYLSARKTLILNCLSPNRDKATAPNRGKRTAPNRGKRTAPNGGIGTAPLFTNKSKDCPQTRDCRQ